jgi:hypothetical protein
MQRRKSSRIGQEVGERGSNRRDGEQNGQKRGRRKKQRGKERVKCPSERRACPRRVHATEVQIVYAVAQSSKGARATGTPNNLIVIWPAVWARPFRASRSIQERRECARCARDRTTLVGGGGAEVGGDSFTSSRWWRSRCMHARRCVLRGQSCQRSGDEPTRSGCRNTLTWRGFAGALPFHWHCSRREQERQR